MDGGTQVFAPRVDGGGQFFKLLIFATRIYPSRNGNSNKQKAQAQAPAKLAVRLNRDKKKATLQMERRLD